MSRKPSPRPALRKAADSDVHPAAPRLVAVMPDVPEVASAATAGKKKGGGGKEEPEAELVIKLSKPLRKKLRAKAQEHGLTAGDATYELIRVWVDG